MKNIVTKFVVIACLLGPVVGWADSVTLTATTPKPLVLTELSNVTVWYSWVDYFVKPNNKLNAEVNATSLGWTLTGPVGFTTQSGSFSDPTGTSSGSDVISFTNLNTGSYKLELVGSWSFADAKSGAQIITPGSVSLDSPSISAVTSVPEPESYAMLLAGLGLIGTIAVRRRAKDNA